MSEDINSSAFKCFRQHSSRQDLGPPKNSCLPCPPFKSLTCSSKEAGVPGRCNRAASSSWLALSSFAACGSLEAQNLKGKVERNLNAKQTSGQTTGEAEWSANPIHAQLLVISLNQGPEEPNNTKKKHRVTHCCKWARLRQRS